MKDGPVYGKFDVRRTDGTDAPGQKHDGCRYFVLDVVHDKFATAALLAYAEACKETYPMLAQSIIEELIVGGGVQD